MMLMVAAFSLIEAGVHAWMFQPIPWNESLQRVAQRGMHRINRRWPERHFYLFWNTMRLVVLLLLSSPYWWHAEWIATAGMVLLSWGIHEIFFTIGLNTFRNRAPDYLGKITSKSSGYDALLHKLFGDHAFDMKILIAISMITVAAMCVYTHFSKHP